ncbi:serine/threonine-protein kinase [Actinomadura keratinilytica]
MRPVGSKYLLEEPLGRGATGTVWRARQTVPAGAEAAVTGSPGETVAIKVLKEELASDPDIVMRFLRERSVLLRLTHPNIVRVRDLVVEGDLLALVMDLVDGPDLHRYLRENGPLSPVAASLLTAQVADALAASHADGVVHRDLKPANVLLRESGGELHPLLTDFGIARLADSPGLTRTHEFVGTPAYVAPESAEGRPQTSAVDIYGAGILLYELLTGRPPFAAAPRSKSSTGTWRRSPPGPGTSPSPCGPWSNAACARTRTSGPAPRTSPAPCAPSPRASACTPPARRSPPPRAWARCSPPTRPRPRSRRTPAATRTPPPPSCPPPAPPAATTRPPPPASCRTPAPARADAAATPTRPR